LARRLEKVEEMATINTKIEIGGREGNQLPLRRAKTSERCRISEVRNEMEEVFFSDSCFANECAAETVKRGDLKSCRKESE
jgi:hypothetical protein